MILCITWFHNSDEFWETVFFHVRIYKKSSAGDGIVAIW